MLFDLAYEKLTGKTAKTPSVVINVSDPVYKAEWQAKQDKIAKDNQAIKDDIKKRTSKVAALAREETAQYQTSMSTDLQTSKPKSNTMKIIDNIITWIKTHVVYAILILVGLWLVWRYVLRGR